MFVEPGDVQLAAFEELLTQPILDCAWRYAYRLCHQREDAEDLLQDALAHAYNRLRQLNEPAAFKSWLMCIIRSQFLMQIRRRRVENHIQAGTDDRTLKLEDPRSLGHPTQEEMEVYAALFQLPESQREILELFYLDELNLAETASVLGLTLGAVQQRLFRARGALRRAVRTLNASDAVNAYASVTK